jgi:hypothetical protein
MEYTLEMAEKMAEKLRHLPAIDASKRRLSKQTVVRHLAAEIVSLQERGYTLEQVAESLCGVGLEITTPTLKSYLQRLKEKPAKSPRRQRPKAAAQPVGQPERLRPPSAPTPVKEAATPEPPPTAPRSTRSEFIATDRPKL